MKRVTTPSTEPEILANFRCQHPYGTWKRKTNSGQCAFKDELDNHHVFEALAKEQGHICAYCEIYIVRGLRGQVEHFEPEDASTTARNLALEFQNMVACCEGGTQAKIPNGRSEPPVKKTQHCGQLKDSRHPLLPNQCIVDPRQLPATPCLWAFSSKDGSMDANSEACAEAAVQIELAQGTIHHLGLDRSGLRRMRRELLEALDDELLELLEQESEELDPFHLIASEQLVPDSEGRLPSFWSCIRHWAGEAAERVIIAQGHLIPGLASP